MWKTINYISAGGKVMYDKTYDYFQYYLSWDNKSEDDLDNITEDNLKSYESFLEIKKYVDETGNHRILPKVGYYDELSHFFGNPTHIIDNIYLGSAFNAASYECLNSLNIKVIFNITKEISNYYPDDFIYLRYNIYDNNKNSIGKYLEKAFSDIKHHQRNTEGNILVHCYMGASRSASVIIYYLMKTQKNKNGDQLSFDEALDFIKEKRAIVNPTFRFTKDLAKSMINFN